MSGFEEAIKLRQGLVVPKPQGFRTKNELRLLNSQTGRFDQVLSIQHRASEEHPYLPVYVTNGKRSNPYRATVKRAVDGAGELWSYKSVAYDIYRGPEAITYFEKQRADFLSGKQVFEEIFGIPVRLVRSTWRGLPKHIQIMPWLGNDLIEHITQNGNDYGPLLDRLDMMLKASMQLFALHQHGIVHFDFKLENICIDEKSDIQVIDFSRLKPSEMKADSHPPEFTPAYASPEFLLDHLNCSGVSSAGDVYALGKTIARLCPEFGIDLILTGHVDTVADIPYYQQQKDINTDHATDNARFILPMLEADPMKRASMHQSISNLVNLIKHIKGLMHSDVVGIEAYALDFCELYKNVVSLPKTSETRKLSVKILNTMQSKSGLTASADSLAALRSEFIVIASPASIARPETPKTVLLPTPDSAASTAASWASSRSNSPVAISFGSINQGGLISAALTSTPKESFMFRVYGEMLSMMTPEQTPLP